MKKSFNILLLSGEVSADYYGSLLAEKLKELDPSTKIFAIGGQNLAKIADCFIFETANQHHIGFSTLIKSKFWKQVLKELNQTIIKNQIDLAVIIDFGFYNFKLARLLKKFSLPIITFITPNFWIWNDIKRAKGIINYSQKIVNIYPDEFKYYQNLKADNYYFGHPLVKLIPENTWKINKNSQHILLLPGSRKVEIKLLLPVMLKTVKKLQIELPNAHFYLAATNDHFLNLIEFYLEKEKINNMPILINQDRVNLFENIDFVITASGTSTLECVLFNKPMVVLGALSKFTFFIGKYILKLKLKYISLPNIILNKVVVKEFIQNNLKPDKIALEVLRLLNKDDHKDLFCDYQLIRAALDLNYDVFLETAKLILKKDFYVNKCSYK
ncbi:MAG: lipid-A-disaccharide synthase [Candidatus Margulisiibacteriota bacterium]|jgi:lipid-A-disaccharide synthase